MLVIDGGMALECQ